MQYKLNLCCNIAVWSSNLLLVSCAMRLKWGWLRCRECWWNVRGWTGCWWRHGTFFHPYSGPCTCSEASRWYARWGSWMLSSPLPPRWWRRRSRLHRPATLSSRIYGIIRWRSREGIPRFIQSGFCGRLRSHCPRSFLFWCKGPPPRHHPWQLPSAARSRQCAGLLFSRRQ